MKRKYHGKYHKKYGNNKWGKNNYFSNGPTIPTFTYYCINCGDYELHTKPNIYHCETCHRRLVLCSK
jgi:hypothetical protein